MRILEDSNYFLGRMRIKKVDYYHLSKIKYQQNRILCPKTLFRPECVPFGTSIFELFFGKDEKIHLETRFFTQNTWYRQ